MKICPKCTKELHLQEFAWRNEKAGTRQSQCNDCRRETARQSYQRHKHKTISNVTKRSRVYAQQNRAWKELLSCCVCGEDCRICLEFHHIDPSTKENVVGLMMGNSTLNQIMREAEKCVVVCSNCHKKVHADIIELTPTNIKRSSDNILTAYHQIKAD